MGHSISTLGRMGREIAELRERCNEIWEEHPDAENLEDLPSELAQEVKEAEARIIEIKNM